MNPSVYFQAVRCYAASAGLSKDEVTGRIMDLLKNFDKVMLMRLDFEKVANAETGHRCLQGSYQPRVKDWRQMLIFFS